MRSKNPVQCSDKHGRKAGRHSHLVSVKIHLTAFLQSNWFTLIIQLRIWPTQPHACQRMTFQQTTVNMKTGLVGLASCRWDDEVPGFAGTCSLCSHATVKVDPEYRNLHTNYTHSQSTRPRPQKYLLSQMLLLFHELTCCRKRVN